jgi:hypothetical protein
MQETAICAMWSVIDVTQVVRTCDDPCVFTCQHFPFGLGWQGCFLERRSRHIYLFGLGGITFFRYSAPDTYERAEFADPLQ